MEIPFKRVVWNEHETALLVDTFEKVREGVVSRDKAIVNLSKRLRNRMVLDGIVINEKYRNVAGMDLQLLSLERSVDSNGNLVEGNHLSQIFAKYICLVEMKEKLITQCYQMQICCIQKSLMRRYFRMLTQM